MVHVRFITDQETVVTVPVRPDVDRWVPVSYTHLIILGNVMIALPQESNSLRWLLISYYT